MLSIDSMNFEDNLDYKAWFSKMIGLASFDEDKILLSFVLFRTMVPNDTEMNHFKEGIMNAAKVDALDKEYLEIIENSNYYLIWTKKVRADILRFFNANKNYNDERNQKFKNLARKSFLTYLKAISIFSPYAAKTLALDVTKDKKISFLKDVALYYVNVSNPIEEDELLNFDFECFRSLSTILYSPVNLDLEDCLKCKININYDSL